MTKQSNPPDLIGGPYEMPPVNIGDVVACEVRGDMAVTGVSDGPIRWVVGRPAAGRGRTSLIVCRGLIAHPGLADAVRVESEAAVCHWFGVSRSAVVRWRKALGVGRVTPGTSALLADRPPPAPTVEEARARGRKGARKRWDKGGD